MSSNGSFAGRQVYHVGQTYSYGVPHGIGCQICIDQGKFYFYEGMFKDGKMSGYGRRLMQFTNLTNADSIVEGVFKDDKPYGPFIQLPLTVDD